MTEFERGFATKCAEYGLTENQAGFLYKMSDAVADMASAVDSTATEGMDDYGKQRYNYYMHFRPGADKNLPGTAIGRWFWRNRYHTPEEYAGRYRAAVEEASREAAAKALEDVKRRASEKARTIETTSSSAKKVRDAEVAATSSTNAPAATVTNAAPAAVSSLPSGVTPAAPVSRGRGRGR